MTKSIFLHDFDENLTESISSFDISYTRDVLTIVVLAPTRYICYGSFNISKNFEKIQSYSYDLYINQDNYFIKQTDKLLKILFIQQNGIESIIV